MTAVTECAETTAVVMECDGGRLSDSETDFNTRQCVLGTSYVAR